VKVKHIVQFVFYVLDKHVEDPSTLISSEIVDV